MEYGKILTRAWQLIWKYKILWLFGFLANCGGNTGANSTTSSRGNPTIQYNYNNDPTRLPPGILRFLENLERFVSLHAEQITLWVILIVAAALLLSAITFFIRVYGKVGLVRGILRADGDEPDTLSFNEIHDEVRPYFWRLAGFQLILFVASFLLVLIFGGIVVFGTIVTFGLGLLCLIPLLCIFVPLSWALSVLIEQATIAMLIEDLDIAAALRRGWEVIRSNPAEYLVMSLILLIGGAIIGVIFSLPQILAMVPVFSAFFAGFFSGNWDGFGPGLIGAGVCLVAYWPVFAALRGMLTSYINSSWVLTFLQLTTPQDPAQNPPELPEPPEPGLETA